jgi:hypothetical protein
MEYGPMPRVCEGGYFWFRSELLSQTVIDGAKTGISFSDIHPYNCSQVPDDQILSLEGMAIRLLPRWCMSSSVL